MFNMYKIMRLSILCVSMLAVLFAFSPFGAYAQKSCAPPGQCDPDLGTTCNFDDVMVNKLKANFTFMHFPIDVYPDRLTISGYLGVDPTDPGINCDFNYNRVRYKMPCDIDAKQTETAIGVSIYVNYGGVAPPQLVFSDNIPKATPVTCSKKFRYKGTAFLDPNVEYDLKFEPRSKDRTYFNISVDNLFFLQGNIQDKLAPAQIPCAIPAPSPCNGACDMAPPVGGFFECSNYLDQLRGIVSFDIIFDVDGNKWQALNVPLEFNKLTCCQTPSKQEFKIRWKKTACDLAKKDKCIDADGIKTPGRGLTPEEVDVFKGAILTTWPGPIFPDPDNHGIDSFDNDGTDTWTFGDDLHIEGDSAVCKGDRNREYTAGKDCPVLDINASLFDGQRVDCDLESGNDPWNNISCPPELLGTLKFYDQNGDGFWDDGEDIIFDTDGDGFFH